MYWTWLGKLISDALMIIIILMLLINNVWELGLRGKELMSFM